MIPQRKEEALRWRKSTRSGNSAGECLELALVVGGGLAVRDSKSPGTGVVVVGERARLMFLETVKGNRF
ncbi:DUF397 domain-containing protein [Saccharothrix coeruleofusca]|uniref:DUF397 domain-containing protein n=1 Tax=Saccharothrix coeruleofusca TaxID=33919 RepID=A0A918AXL2_9PSEU|nr:hypothetical protein GCM10010185_69270 [Saccharothrix coeruleofusca]